MGKSPKEDNRVFLRYDGELPNGVAIKIRIRGILPQGAIRLIKDVRRMGRAIALHFNNKDDRSKMREHKELLYKAARCTSSEATDKWTKILYRKNPNPLYRGRRHPGRDQRRRRRPKRNPQRENNPPKGHNPTTGPGNGTEQYHPHLRGRNLPPKNHRLLRQN